MRAAGRSTRLLDILKAIAGIRETVGGLELETYTTVWSIKHACERGIEIISEASRHIPDELKNSAPEIPWQQIAAIGNVLRHGYEAISDYVVWDIIENHLGPLEEATSKLLVIVDSTESTIRPLK